MRSIIAIVIIILAYIEQTSGSYDGAFYFSGGVTIAGAALSLLCFIIERRHAFVDTWTTVKDFDYRAFKRRERKREIRRASIRQQRRESLRRFGSQIRRVGSIRGSSFRGSMRQKVRDINTIAEAEGGVAET